MTLSLSNLERLLAAATPRPWRVADEIESDGRRRIYNVLGPSETRDYGMGPEPYQERIVETNCGHYGPKPPDADLIVAAVNALPHLLAVVEAAEAWRVARAAFDQSEFTLTGQAAVHDAEHALRAALSTLKDPP